MHPTALELLIAEVSPAVAGLSVKDARLDATTGALHLTLAARAPRVLTLAPEPPGVLFVAPAGRQPGAAAGARRRGRAEAKRRGGRSDYSPIVRELATATIEEVRKGPRPSAVEVVFSRSDSGGRTRRRALLVELNRRPGLSLVEPGTGAQPEADAAPAAREAPPAPGPPTVHWRHDPQGRLHASISAGPPTSPCEGSREFATCNDAAAHVFAEFGVPMAVERLRHRLLRQARTEFERKARAAEKVRAEIEESARADEYRRLGQLLLSRKDQVRRGDVVARVLDYDNATAVEIPLNAALTVAQNAEALFRRAKRAERRAEKAPARLAQLGPETERARALVEEIERADAHALGAIEARLAPPERGGQAPRTADGDRARFRTYTVTGGWQVLVGKSNRDNDVLTHKVARPGDLWFHARQAAGSHVILRKAGTGREPDQAAILEAAAIAAYHSKAGTSKRAAVCYTEARFVRKPRGSAPGLAVVAREKVVMVAPKLPEA